MVLSIFKSVVVCLICWLFGGLSKLSLVSDVFYCFVFNNNWLILLVRIFGVLWLLWCLKVCLEFNWYIIFGLMCLVWLVCCMVEEWEIFCVISFVIFVFKLKLVVWCLLLLIIMCIFLMVKLVLVILVVNIILCLLFLVGVIVVCCLFLFCLLYKLNILILLFKLFRDCWIWMILCCFGKNIKVLFVCLLSVCFIIVGMLLS